MRNEDTYRIECVNSMAEDTIVSLCNLYQPLIGGEGVLLYLTLHAEAKHQRNPIMHLQLVKLLNMSLDQIERSRFKLEQYNLLRTFAKENENFTSYIYHLNTPIGTVDFLANKVFMNAFVNTLGNEVSQQIISRLGSVGINTTGYREVTKPYNNVSFPQDYTVKTNFTPVQPTYSFSDDASIDFDYAKFLSVTSDLVFPLALRTKENMHLIGKYGTLYNIDVDRMKIIVKNSCRLNPLSFNQEKFQELCASQNVTVKDVKDPLSLSPIAYLAYRNNNKPLSATEKKIVEKLSVSYGWSYEVVNILIDYVLKRSENRLIGKFVEMVASEWARDHVQTKEDAFKAAQKEIQTKTTNKAIFKVPLPSYYDKPTDTTPASEEQLARIRALQEQRRKEKNNG